MEGLSLDTAGRNWYNNFPFKISEGFMIAADIRQDFPCQRTLMCG